MPIGIMKIKGADGTVHSVPALKGDASMWYTGTAVTGTGTGIAATVTGSKQYDMYLNTTTKRVYQATNANVWDYKFTNVSHYDARFVIGNTSAGYTVDQCDYLCDGTDDQVEINAAIAALPATGGKIVLLDGAYNITANITVNKVNVELCGTIAAQLTFANAAYINVNKSSCAVHDLTLIGTQTATSKPVLYMSSIYGQAYNLHIDKGGITLDYVTCATITNNIINGEGYNAAINIINNSCTVIISGNDFSGSYYGVHADNSEQLNIVNNTSNLFNEAGVWLANCRWVNITNNIFYTAAGGSVWGIYCSACRRVLIDANNISIDYNGVPNPCITLYGTYTSVISNNILRTLTADYAINLVSSCNYINCVNNAIMSVYTGDIDSTQSTNCSVSGNMNWPSDL